MVKLDNKEYPFSDLMSGTRFRIPEYQRYYSWKSENWNDLWEDLTNLIEDGTTNRTHYMGTVVVKWEKELDSGLESINQYEIVDGQQRLTTISILANNLLNSLKKAENTERRNIEDMEKKFIQNTNIKGVSPQKIELQRENVKDNKIYKDVIKGKTTNPETPSQNLIIEANEFFADKVNNLNSEDKKELLKVISSLKFMTYVVEDDEQATLIFESINDRGRGLSKLEKTKSFLMHQIYLLKTEEENVKGDIDEIKEAFSEIYLNLQRINNCKLVEGFEEDALQRDHFVTYSKEDVFVEYLKGQGYANYTRKTAGSNYFQIIKWQVEKLRREDEEKCLEYIKNYSEDLSNFVNEFRKIVEQAENNELEHFKNILLLGKYTNFVPLLVSGKQNLNESQYNELTELIESSIIRLYVIGDRRSNTGRSQFFRYAYQLKSEEKKYSEIKEDIVDTVEGYENLEDFRQKSESKSFYKNLNTSEIRFIFYYYDKKLKQEQKMEDMTIKLDEVVMNENNYGIDHILPQNGDKISFKEKKGITKEEWKNSKHKVGNLTITTGPRNSEMQNKPPSEKMHKFKNSDFRISRNVHKFYKENGQVWNKETVNRRTEQVRDFITQKWGFKDEEVSTR